MHSELDESAVIRGLRDGDRTAWTTLYDRYGVDVWRFVARLIGLDAASVADVVQDVFLTAARSAKGFDETRGSLWAWLSGIAQHHVAAHWRECGRLARLQRLLETEGLEVRRLLDRSEPIGQLLERQERTDLVRFVLAEMTNDYAALLMAKYLDEQSLEEVAKQFGSTVEATKSKLARARREFRSKFEHCSQELTPK